MPLSVYLFLLVELAFVTYGDLKTNKIPNYWAILNVCLFILLLFLLPKTYIFHWRTFIYSGVFLFVGFFLFTLNIMGGGDSKYLFSFYLLIPEWIQEQAITFLLISTVIVGTYLFLLNTSTNFLKLKLIFQHRTYYQLKEIYGKKFSYAPVIFISWVWLGWSIKLFLNE